MITRACKRTKPLELVLLPFRHPDPKIQVFGGKSVGPA
jgi:hypothetical protein